jgi:hypothetical protein
MSWYRTLIPSQLARSGRVAIAIAASALGAGAVAGPALAAPIVDGSGNYTFQKINNNTDPTFNQLLGINDSGLIAGYFGSGQAGHPNQGYLLSPPYGKGIYRSENFPGSVQTQVTGLNNRGVTVGFYSHQNNANLVNENAGFYRTDGGAFHAVKFPTSDNSAPPVNQLLGVNDRDIAVGFYTDNNATNHGYSYNIRTQMFHSITVSGDSNVTAAAINDLNDVAGFATNSAGNTEAFLLRSNGTLITLDVPGATSTQAFGVNNGDQVVGDYVDGTGSTATMHGFTWTPRRGFETVNDPDGTDTTTINGVNDRGELVGFYVDAAGNTDGMLATPQP